MEENVFAQDISGFRKFIKVEGEERGKEGVSRILHTLLQQPYKERVIMPII